jgi:hypothetical protein
MKFKANVSTFMYIEMPFLLYDDFIVRLSVSSKGGRRFVEGVEWSSCGYLMEVLGYLYINTTSEGSAFG